MSIDANDVVSFLLLYLFVGSVVWMLLIDELRTSKINFITASFWTVLLWPAVLLHLAGKAFRF